MRIKINEKKKEELDEMSGVGAISGAPGGIGVEKRRQNTQNNTEEEEILGEMYSTSGATIGAGRSLTSDDDNDVFDGQIKRAKMQGLQNFKGLEEENEEIIEEVFNYFHYLLTNPRK